MLILSGIIGVALLLLLGFTTNFWIALVILTVWGVASSIDDPIRRAYMNGLIPSSARATVLSFESLMGNVGGIGIQPALGRVTDQSGYAFSLVIGGVISAVAVPFIALSRAQNAGGCGDRRGGTGRGRGSGCRVSNRGVGRGFQATGVARRSSKTRNCAGSASAYSGCHCTPVIGAVSCTTASITPSGANPTAMSPSPSLSIA
ncbi:hypothetical protein BH09ACT4_BH09ACT4_10550 [soil metagenome]